HDVKKYFGNRAKRVPFSFLYRNDSLYVLQDASKEYLVKEGSIITKINGVESKDLVEQMIIFQSSDGFNRTLPLWDISRNFTKNYAVVYGTPNSFDIEYISQNNSTNKVKIKAIRKSEFSKNRKTMSKKNDYEFTVLNDKAILTIATFDISDLKSYNKFLKNTFNKINKLQINKLIVDVRGNLGGRPEASDELLSFLIEKEIHPIKRQYALVDQLPEKEYFLKNEVFKYFHKENFKNNNDTIIVKNASFHKIKPQKDRYSGKIVFLIDENCVSTTSSMLGQVKTHLNAKFVGTETGGNPVTVVANFTVTQILPNSKLEFKLPLIKSEKNVTFANNGRGIIPTVKIEPGVNDLLNNNDLVLKKGIELLENNCTKQSIEY
ncbi:MAG: S41 family peptidase, partial [Flavobacteriaceae bacterium]